MINLRIISRLSWLSCLKTFHVRSVSSPSELVLREASPPPEEIELFVMNGSRNYSFVTPLDMISSPNASDL